MTGTNLIVKFIGLDLISRVAERAGNSVDRLENRIKRAGGMSAQAWVASGIAATTFGVSMLAAAGAATAAAVHFVEVAAEFNSQMTLLHTHANVAASEIGKLTDFILRLAPAVGFGPTELAKAMYRVESVMSSLPEKLRTTAQAEELLTAGAKLAAIGHSDLEQTVKAVGNAFVVYSKNGMTASQITSVMNQAIGEGDMRMQDWVAGMATGVLPVAQQAGIKFQSLAAAIATLTDAGIPATRASTYLRSAIIQMTLPSGPAIEALKAIGLAEGEAGQRTKDFSLLLEKAGINQSLVAEKLRSSGSFAETLKFLQERLMKAGATATEAGAIISRAFGGIRSGTGMVTLFNNIVGLEAKEKDLNKATNTLDKTWQYFTAHDPAFAIKQLHAGAEALQITIGNALLPYFLKIVNVIGPIIQKLIGWTNAHKQLTAAILIGFIAITAILGILLTLAGFIMIVGGAIGVFAGILGSVAFGPLLAIVAGVLALAGALVWLKTHTTFFNAVGKLMHVILGALQDAFKQLMHSIPHKDVQKLTTLAGQLGKVIETYILPIVAAWIAINLILIGGVFHALIAILSAAIPAAIQITIGILQVVIGVFELVGGTVVFLVKIVNDLIHGNWHQAWVDAQQYVHLMGNAVQSIVSGLTNVVTGLFTGMVNIVKGAIWGLVSGIIGAFQNLYHVLVGGSIVPDLVNSIVNWFWSLPGRVGGALGAMVGDAWNAGWSIANGIANGLSAGAWTIINAARNAASRALNAAKNFLGIFSPSKVMAEQVGMPMAQGVALGISQGSSDMNSALTRSLPTSAHSSGDSTYDLLCAIKDVLVDIRDKQPQSQSGSQGTGQTPINTQGSRDLLNQLASLLFDLTQKGAMRRAQMGLRAEYSY